MTEAQFEDYGTSKNTGGGAGGNRVKDVQIFIGVTRMVRIRNEYSNRIEQFGDKTRVEDGFCIWRDSGHIVQS